MSIEKTIEHEVKSFITKEFGQTPADNVIQLQKTRKEFKGDITLVVFPLVKLIRKSPEQAADIIGLHLKDVTTEVTGYNVVKGFLNLEISATYWRQALSILYGEKEAIVDYAADEMATMIEYSSPNTNKPLHLGHIRNNLLGHSVAKILQGAGNKVIKVNLVNDRGIHICKSMLAWDKWGGGETPESSGLKGDHLVGKYYVRFDLEYKKQIKELTKKGIPAKEAEKQAPLILEAQEMLRKWEAGNTDVNALWKKMNAWVYAGFEETYEKMGVTFDKIYYESETYKLGKSKVLEGLEKKVLFKKEDGSVWANLKEEGLDQKLLLRADGTSVYMTQDIGTAIQRFEQYPVKELIYVVGNEQNYHFQVLSIIMKKLGYDFADNLHHLSYGMVELPEGKMKSREGTVVDADDLIEEMITTAREMSEEMGKLDGFEQTEKENIYRILGLGALKYFILKVDPRKNMTFDPKESIDFNGNTGPFIQYTTTRLKSVMRKSVEKQIILPSQIPGSVVPNEKEIGIIKLLKDYRAIILEAASEQSPAIIANYIYELAREFNQFYHDYSILHEESEDIRQLRLILSKQTLKILTHGLDLLGVETPERM